MKQLIQQIMESRASQHPDVGPASRGAAEVAVNQPIDFGVRLPGPRGRPGR